AILAAYKRALEPYSDTFLTGPDMGTQPADFVEEEHAGELPLWAKSHKGLDLDDLATGAGVAGGAGAALAHTRRTPRGGAVVIRGFRQVGGGRADLHQPRVRGPCRSDRPRRRAPHRAARHAWRPARRARARAFPNAR